MSENYEVEDREEEGMDLLGLLGIAASDPMDQSVLQALTVRIQSSAGGVIDVPVEEDHMEGNFPGYLLADLLDMANLTVAPNTQYWLGETQVQLDTVIAPGATITAIGLMKGG